MLNLAFSSFPTLTTHRLSLTELTESDAAAIQRLRSDDEVNIHLDRPGNISIAEAKSFIGIINRGLNKEWVYWKISPIPEQSLIGTICIWNIDHEKQIGEIGYELFPEHQGKGLMQEAMAAVIRFAFQTIGFKTLTAFPKHANLRSIRLLQKNNFKPDEKLEYLDISLMEECASFYLHHSDL